jgi:serine/threonine protein kinase
VLSRITILKKLGAGGMGEVYLAEDTQLERQIAPSILEAAGFYVAELSGTEKRRLRYEAAAEF